MNATIQAVSEALGLPGELPPCASPGRAAGRRRAGRAPRRGRPPGGRPGRAPRLPLRDRRARVERRLRAPPDLAAAAPPDLPARLDPRRPRAPPLPVDRGEAPVRELVRARGDGHVRPRPRGPPQPLPRQPARRLARRGVGAAQGLPPRPAGAAGPGLAAPVSSGDGRRGLPGCPWGPCTPASSSPGISASAWPASPCSTCSSASSTCTRERRSASSGCRGATGSSSPSPISGDTAVGHALAFAHAIERLTGCEPPPRARYLRVVLLELERIYNHLADIGAIATDVAFSVPAAHAQLLRERLVALQERLFGSRLLRGTVAIGGVKTDLSAAGREELVAHLGRLKSDFESLVTLLIDSGSFTDRIDGTGTLPTEAARDLGVTGLAARASGLDEDLRRDHPHDAYDALRFEVPVEEGGDVRARLMVRAREVEQSIGDPPPGPRRAARLSAADAAPGGAAGLLRGAGLGRGRGAAPACTGWRPTPTARSPASRSPIRASGTGPASRRPCRATSSRTSPSSTRASTCRTRATTGSDEEERCSESWPAAPAPGS